MRMHMSIHTRKLLHFLVLGLVVINLWIVVFYATDYIANNDMARDLVGQFGYLGVLVISIIAGLNIFVPIPAATFVPVFTAAGLLFPFIIIALVIGTTIADIIGYFIGRWSKKLTEEHYPRTYSRMLFLNAEHNNLILPLVFIYAAFIPFPNEAIIIPLALVGFRFHSLFIPLVLGTIVNQTALAYGVVNIFALIF